ncbi:MAG TPA: allantoinase AllB [Polyangia bacterium]|nr:allantoinase AllB [Polyangia bacterium]
MSALADHEGPWALRSRRVVTDAGVQAATVWIDEQKIRAVLVGGDAAALPTEIPLHDVGDRVVAPGLVDSHVHVNEPGRTDWEGFATATRAAAAGGVTALVDMPLNCLPVTTRRAALEEKRRAAEGQLWVDVGFWGGVVPGNAGELPGLAEAGALGCKAFLVHSGIEEFPNATEADLRVAMPALRAAGLPLLAHAELDLGAPDDAWTGGRAYDGYLRSRPAAWEDAAIALLIRLARETGCAVHVVHLSSASSLPQIARAKEEGLPLTVETCPHYLCLEAEAVPDGATEFKCAPPIRERENREALWWGLARGVIDLVVTDHSPCTPALKARERGDFAAAWGGIASLQLGLPAVWTEARRRGHGLADLAAWMSARPAALAGLARRKGRLAPGLDADLVVWDPDAEISVEAARLHFRHKISPYLGRRLIGRVEATVLRGRLVYDGGQLAVGPVGRPLLGRDTRA